MGEKGEGSGGKGGGNWEWGTPLSTPSSILVDIYTYYSFISNLLTHLSQMEFSTLIKKTSPFHFKGCWVVFFIFIQILIKH